MWTHWAGYAGTALVIVAYLPQILHLVVMRCSAGISLRAFAIWTVASLLLVIHAIGISAPVFIALAGSQFGATLTISCLAWIYKDRLCEKHRSGEGAEKNGHHSLAKEYSVNYLDVA